jgi:F0F1-type ATP synthase membrane subunit c/vacuolar-type H+-ATPase subunit K
MNSRVWRAGSVYGLGTDAERGDGVAQLRLIWAQVAFALVMLAVVIGFTVPWTAEDPEGGIAPVAVLVGGLVLAAIGIGGALWNRHRAYACVPADELQGLFATRMFVGIALSDIPALLSFAVAFIFEEGWLYLVGLAMSLVGLALSAPSRANVERVDADLRAQGCPHALGESLAKP